MSSPTRPRARVTIRHVAEKAGVAVGTVSRVLKGADTVAPDIAERVRAAIAELRYVPSLAAQSLRGQGSRTIGCIVPDVSNRLYAQVVDAVKDAVRARGYSIIVMNTGHVVDREVRSIETAMRWDVEGLILVGGFEDRPEVEALLGRLGFPLVQIDRARADTTTVRVDHGKGLREAIGYLLAAGHRRIGLVTPDGSSLQSRERMRAFEEICRVKGVEDNLALVRCVEVNENAGYDAAYDLLTADAPPTAVVTLGGDVLAGVLRFVRMRGIELPRDLSLVAIGDNELTRSLDPPLTAVSWNFRALGASAVEALFARILDRESDGTRVTTIDCRLIERESVRRLDPPAEGDG